MTVVRPATKEDAKEILEIYAPSILTAISFESAVPSIEEMQHRIASCLEKYPWIVCVVDGKLAGYVYASRHREREAYQWSCECSVYIHQKFKGKGMGKALYRLLFQILEKQQFRNVYAGITLPNEASVKLHENCGFEHFASYENIGYKLGRWHTVGWWKLRINKYDPDPPPPVKFPELEAGPLTRLFEQAGQHLQSKLNGH